MYVKSKGQGQIVSLVQWVKISVNDILKYFSKKIGFGISCKLSPMETVCMTFQILFSRKNKKKLSLFCCLLNLPIAC